MSSHNIHVCFTNKWVKVDGLSSDYNITDCALIRVCAVIRSNMVNFDHESDLISSATSEEYLSSKASILESNDNTHKTENS